MTSRSATRHRLVVLASGTALAGLLSASMFAGSASADPDPNNPGTPPPGISDPSFILAGVGADADPELIQNVTVAYNATVTTPSATTPVLASYDAVNPKTGAVHENIVTKPGCTPSARPQGTGEGFTALVADPQSSIGTGVHCIDFNRSSSAKATDGSQSSLDFWTLGQDAVDWVTVGTAYAPPSALSITQLRDIFTCQVTDWAQVGGQEGAIHVYVNPATSGTYKFFLTAIGTTTGAVAAGCGSNVTTIQQVDGTLLAGDPQGIAPYAVSKWAGQKNAPAGFVDKRGGTVLGHIKDATAPTTIQSLDSTDYTVLNPSFANNGPQGRYLYNVTRSTDSAASQTLFGNIFGTTGYICSNQDELLIPYGVPPLGSSGTVVCGQKS